MPKMRRFVEFLVLFNDFQELRRINFSIGKSTLECKAGENEKVF